jgi:glycine/D-amino acid oxidase-like deaminating enzyme
MDNLRNIIVIGGGLMGSAAAWQLSRKGNGVTLIEQQGPIYSHGSSYGEARISRSLGPEEDVFAWLQQISIRETKKLIHFLNETDKHSVHTMEDVYRTSPVTYLYYKSQEQELQHILHNQNDPYTLATTPEESRKLFGMEITPDMMVIRENKEFSGTLNPQALIAKLHLGIVHSGGTILYNHAVNALTFPDGIYTLNCLNKVSGQTLTLISEKIVSAAGPYTGSLLKTLAPEFEQIILPQQTFLTFFTISKPAWEKLTLEIKKKLADSYPVARMDEFIYYSMIEKYASGIPVIKVGGHLRRHKTDLLDEGWGAPVPQEEINWAKQCTLEYLAMIGITLSPEDLYFTNSYACVYSMTHSEVPFVTPVSNDQNMPSGVVIAGLSGVGAKGALAYGLLAADYLVGENEGTEMYLKTAQALGPERIDQFKKGISEIAVKKSTL